MMRDYSKTSARYKYGAGGSIKPQLPNDPVTTWDWLKGEEEHEENQQKDTSSEQKSRTQSGENSPSNMRPDEDRGEDI